jgi:hypothetical protein
MGNEGQIGRVNVILGRKKHFSTDFPQEDQGDKTWIE